MNMTDIKTDAHSIGLLCNSLNAHHTAAAHRGDEVLSNLLLKAQGTITKLYEENCALKKAEEIGLLCNSLNAHYIAAAHRGDEILSNLLLKAQGTITKLYEENCALKKAEEEE